MKEFLKNIKKVFESNNYNDLSNSVEEKQFLFLYALYHYYYGDEDCCGDVIDHCKYTREFENFAQGFFEEDTYEDKVIDVLIPYYVEKDFDMLQVNYRISQTQAMIMQIKNNSYSFLGNETLLTDYWNPSSEEKLVLRIITNYQPDFEEKNRITNMINKLVPLMETIKFDIVFGDDIIDEISQLTSDKKSVDYGELLLEKENNYLTYGEEESIITNITAFSLKDNFVKFGKAGLFAMNLRFYIANKKVDESNMSDTEKRLQKEKNDKRLQDKLDADDDLMKQADKEARKAINKDIAIGATKEIGKKAGIDALKTMAVSALFSLLKEIMNGLVRFLKEQEKSFEKFLSEMKLAIKKFLAKITSVLQTGASTLVGTIISEIFGPIVSTFKKLASLIKQGVASLMEAVKYLTDKTNKNKPFSVKVAQIGKIVTAGLVTGGAIFLGELFEKVLLGVPGMQIQLPLIGTLANVIGLFLSSLVSGLIGAIVINLIDKFIAKHQKSENISAQVDKGNEVLNLQYQLRVVSEVKLEEEKADVANSIKERHEAAADMMKESLGNIMENCKFDESIQNSFDDIDELLTELEDE